MKNNNINKLNCPKLNIFIDDDVVVEDGVILQPNITILGKSVIKRGAKIGSNSIIENSVIESRTVIKSSFITDSTIGEDTIIGPWAHIRNQSVIGAFVRIGNFVEIKKSVLKAETKVAHLTYIGDAFIGENCNIGCGVVFCNYDGRDKHVTVVGDRVFIGSNSNLIAPVVLEDETFIAAGSTITKDVKKGEFAIARARQETKQDFENKYLKKNK